MSTTWTTSPSSKIIRWRVRDWVSCFLASRIPLDDHDPEIRNMVRDFSGGGSQCRYHHQNIRRNRRRKDRRVGENISSAKNHIIVAEKESDINRDGVNNDMPSKDLMKPTETASVEDYIVFCFGENGAFEVVKDCKRNKSPHRSTTTHDDDHHHTKSSAAKHNASRKLNYGDQGIACGHESCKKLSSSTDGDSEVVIHLHEEEDNGSSKEIRHPLEVMDGNPLGTADSEPSCDSNKSDDSSSDSFSFPVLQWEEMVGSPIQMPKPEDFHLRKQRLNCARFQCCRF